MKKISFLLVFILIYLTSCNTSVPSTYISSADDNTTYFYTVSFDTNGGSYVPPVRIISGSVVTVPFAPTKEDSEFNGWYINKELTTPYPFGELVESDMTLYARWLNIYTIHFETFGGTTISDIKVKEGYNFLIPDAPKKEGYTFNGWYLDNNHNNQYNFSNLVYNDITLYAYWT